MRSFTDSAGRIWMLSVNVATIKRVRALCNVDLTQIITLESGEQPKFELLERLATDPILLVDVLYALCQPEAERRGVTDITFGEAMAGDTIESATTALLDEIIDFFPSAKRMVLTKIIAATRRFEAKSKTALEAALGNPTFDVSIDAELLKLVDSSTTSPGSSA